MAEGACECPKSTWEKLIGRRDGGRTRDDIPVRPIVMRDRSHFLRIAFLFLIFKLARMGSNIRLVVVETRRQIDFGKFAKSTTGNA